MNTLHQYIDSFLKPRKLSHVDIDLSHNPASQSFFQRKFCVRTFDGLKLVGFVLSHKLPTNNKRKCVIYTHSHSSNMMEGLQLINFCEAAGYSLILYDSRGCGASDSCEITFGEREKTDLLYVILHVMLTEEINYFILWGRSIGCCAVLKLVNQLSFQSNQDAGNVSLQSQDHHNRNNKSDADINFKDSYLQKELKNFITNNPSIAMLSDSMAANIEAIVLDSPIKTINSAVTRFIKQNIVNLSFIASYASNYIQDYLKQKLGKEVLNNQNKDLVAKLNLNSVLIFSENDYFISEADKLEIIRNMGSQATLKRSYKVMNISEAHNETRKMQSLGDIFSVLRIYSEDRAAHKVLLLENPHNFDFTKFSSDFTEHQPMLKSYKSAKLLHVPFASSNQHTESKERTSFFEGKRRSNVDTSAGLKNYEFLTRNQRQQNHVIFNSGTNYTKPLLNSQKSIGNLADKKFINLEANNFHVLQNKKAKKRSPMAFVKSRNYDHNGNNMQPQRTPLSYNIMETLNIRRTEKGVNDNNTSMNKYFKENNEGIHECQSKRRNMYSDRHIPADKNIIAHNYFVPQGFFDNIKKNFEEQRRNNKSKSTRMIDIFNDKTER